MSVTAPSGFVAAGTTSGIKPDGDPDLALVATSSGGAVPAAAVFTSNLAAAAPVAASRSHLAATGGRAAAVVLNSGNANAATGAQGAADAELTCACVAEELGVRASEVLVCSTGLIGIRLPVDRIRAAVPGLVRSLEGGKDAGRAAAEAIMTTDTRSKEVVVERPGFVVGGMAKGAAMLAPNMATMLAVLTTDAAIDPAGLRRALAGAVEESFNRLSVDGSSSTNDTVVVLASCSARARSDEEISAALAEACADLATQMASDAEGGTKVAVVHVSGAATDDDARCAARQVADSLLVKCSLHGGDPYWGRIVSEVGSAGISFDIEKVAVSYGGTEVCRNGVAVAHDTDAVRTHMRGSHVEIACHLGLGEGSGQVIMTDLGHGYIEENSRTS